MFDHVGTYASDRAASQRLLATALATLGIAPTYDGDDYVEWDDFALGAAEPGHPPTRRLHVAFAAPSRAHVDRFWEAAIAAGGRDDGAPGPRPQYRDDYYGGFVRDADGNSIEAVHHGRLRRDGNVDHLWIRVADVAASRAFYEVIAPHAGFRLRSDLPDRAQFVGRSGSFSVVAGEPTEGLHIAFPTADDEAVHAFHRAATEAGYRDNGAPGERPEYHPGYYAAFVLDPDGTNVEVVNHHRG